jgi:hypothetical protein
VQHAHSTVNADMALSVGDEILKSMDGKTPAEEKTSCDTSVKIDGDQIQIDPQLLLQRLVTVVQSSDELKLAFKYELCISPF